ncbi:hypothetical protein [Halorubellus litoreus]|uniref:Uncharacterized protein n=1 Tax=Halorubellus litoreus TaxID=755308 RepID=A0ABD5VDY1_9EURY
MTEDLTLTELADLRADVRQTHELLTELKQDAANIVDRLNHNLDAVSATRLAVEDETTEAELLNEQYGLIMDTRDLASLVYERVEHGDAALREEVDA